MQAFTFYKQLNAMDCGPTCLRMISMYYGKHFTADKLRQMSGFSKAGVSLLSISDTAEKIGFRTRGVKLDFDKLNEVSLPCILHWDQKHFVILLKINQKEVKVADPSKGIIKYKKEEFLSYWLSSKKDSSESTGIALLLEPTPLFFQQESEKVQKLSWVLISKYLSSSRWKLVQVFIALIITSLLQLLFPFLTQSIVDIGINTQNLQFIVVVLIAQIMLTFSQTVINFLRSLLLLKVSNTLNLQILSDFWIKLTRLPISYFDIHHMGDTLQRIGDHSKIQNFLTGTALNSLFSIFNFFIYAFVLVMFNINLFIIFCIGSLIYFIWVQLFLKFRRNLNYENFHLSTKENNATLQLIQGMQEIRLNNAEKQKRWEWENIQVSLFKINIRSLNSSQIQNAGATLINQVQGITISFFVAKMVIEGELTLGTMLAVQYIIGQLSGPIQQWVGFIQSFQDAKISMERLNEIHQLSDEENNEKNYIHQLPTCRSIMFNNVSFTYPSAGNEPVIENINLYIPEKKVTAIVGSSGSGKTTLLKLLLKIHEQYDGEIRIGVSNKDILNEGINFNLISHKFWRDSCGAVLQDGYIFNDSIARNIAIGDEEINYPHLVNSCSIANIHTFIESLPNSYYTKLGADGTGVSQGQKQRILIARAIYKNPSFLFFDEATNALDANNEKEIIENLSTFFEGKTVIVVAHRLSTVKNADKIVVLEKGKIVEEGTHDYLTSLKGKYYKLVKNQLELGN